MNASATKGFFVGCVTSVLALVLFVFLFVLMCGLLVRGCVEAADSDEAQDVGASLRRKIERPEDDENYAKTWVRGEGGVNAPKVLRIRLCAGDRKADLSRSRILMRLKEEKEGI